MYMFMFIHVHHVYDVYMYMFIHVYDVYNVYMYMFVHVHCFFSAGPHYHISILEALAEGGAAEEVGVVN